MQPVLIAEDYASQHRLLQTGFEAAGIPFHICKNTALDISVNLACGNISFVVLNAGKLGNEAVEKICSSKDCRLDTRFFVNIYTYEDPEEISQLRRIGITENHPFPYSPASLIEFIHTSLAENACGKDTFKELTRERIAGLIARLNPSGRQRGNVYICEAVMLVLFGSGLTFNLHRDIYTRIAEKHSTTVKSVEHSIRISVESCWQHADSESKKKLVRSSDISRRPTNAGFIAAVARLIAAQDPAAFHASARLLNSTYPKLHI